MYINDIVMGYIIIMQRISNGMEKCPVVKCPNSFTYNLGRIHAVGTVK